MKPVYSPCKESLPYKFGGTNKMLASGGTVFDDEGEARHVVRKFERFGVCFMKIKKGTKTKLDEDGIKAADETWKAKNKEWAEEVVLDFKRVNKEKLDAGIKVDKPRNVATAAKFLGVALALILSLLIPAAASAQSDTGQHKAANFNYKYDVASATVTYCTMEGQRGDPFASPYDGAGSIETSGSDTTITTVGTSGAFAAIKVGDVIFIRYQNGTVDDRVVITNADNDTITVEAVIDLTGGYVWSYRSIQCGTSDEDGWISTSGYSIVQLVFQYDAGDVTAASMTMECKSDALGAQPVRIYPGIGSDCGDGTLNGAVCEFTSTGDRLGFKMSANAFGACRLGVAWVTADGASRDEITATIDVGR